MGYMFTSQLKRRKLKYHDQVALVVGVLYDGVSLSLVVANYPLSHFLPDSVEKLVLDGMLTKMSPSIFMSSRRCSLRMSNVHCIIEYYILNSIDELVEKDKVIG